MHLSPSYDIVQRVSAAAVGTQFVQLSLGWLVPAVCYLFSTGVLEKSVQSMQWL